MPQAGVVIVAGPTCSGKSALAMALAERFGGSIINADAMQVYRELPILSACPDAADQALVPHHLYGVLSAHQAGSVAWWQAQATAAVTTVLAEGRLPILCGGTGMYLQSLCQGLAEIPDPGEQARNEARGLLAEIGAPALHQRLMAVDPDTGRGLRPSDGQRLARAWEVWRGTGHGLRWWWRQPAVGALDCRFVCILLDPARDILREAIPARFAAMMARGALDEVRGLQAMGLDPALPAMRALGVPSLLAHLEGQTSLEEAVAASCQATIQYTKRQATWFRHRKLAKESATLQFNSTFLPEMKFMEKETHNFLNKILYPS